MKKFCLIMLLLLPIGLQAQKLELVKKSFETYRRGPNDITADRAMEIVNVLLNSKEFRDSLMKLDFKNPDNNCECNPNVRVSNGEIKGKDAYLELFKVAKPQIDLIFKKGHASGGLGKTNACTHKIISFVEACKHNMTHIPLESALAVNICHEYFHSLGYCHTYDALDESDRRANGDEISWKVYEEDITYRVGWIAYDILNRWINVEHRKYPYDK